MYARMLPKAFPRDTPNVKISSSQDQKTLILSTQTPQTTFSLPLFRAFPPTFTSDDVFNEIGAVQSFLSGKTSILVVLGFEKSGKSFNFLAILTRFLQILSNFSLTFGDKFYQFAEVVTPNEIDNLIELISKELHVGITVKLTYNNAEFFLIRGMSYSQKNLQFYQAISHPKIYLRTSKLLQNLPIQHVILQGKYAPDFNVLVCLDYDEMASLRVLEKPCSVYQFLKFLNENVTPKFIVNEFQPDRIYAQTATIQKEMRRRMEGFRDEMLNVQAVLDSERVKFRTEIQTLNGKLQAEMMKNEVLGVRSYALEQENELLREEVERLQEAGAFAFQKLQDNGSTQGSLRQKASLMKKAVDIDDLEMRETNFGKTRKIQYKKVEEW
ncbi:hypothetical protein SS50377_23741 [Spironucleus salmonicida]|uniref:Uncharacterized protein n=1 Tax=Spironucleus salmonicida TaxID=348837 RepID=V6LP88_9EUKA|nr:hypothetical protein SS50377_23741 [Spironucleus salmonicida]|eukprot:EST46420.1 Hypothetical protein SS50377_13504 [Spironucleus salmonicida]